MILFQMLTPFHIIILQGVPHVKLQRQVFSTPPSTPTQCLKHVLKYEGRLQRMPRQYASEIPEQPKDTPIQKSSDKRECVALRSLRKQNWRKSQSTLYQEILHNFGFAKTFYYYFWGMSSCETRVQEKNAMDHLGLKKRDGKQKLR